MMRISWLLAGCAVLGLSGCAGVRLVDTEVRSFTSTALVPTRASYRFERLPSQQAEPAQQTQLEAQAQQALQSVGWQHQVDDAPYSIQVSTGLKISPQSPAAEAGWGWSLGWGLQSSHVAIGAHLPMGRWPGFGIPPAPYYWRQLSLMVRDLRSQRIVFETHAVHDGPWSDSEAIVPALLEAALRGFPNPPAGVRRINIEIPR